MRCQSRSEGEPARRSSRLMEVSKWGVPFVDIAASIWEDTLMSSTPLDSQIVSDPNLRHGEPILVGTATPVRAIAELWNQGMAPEAIPLHLAHLTLQQVFA